MAKSGLADILPLSPLQEGMLFHHLFHEEGGLDVYNVQVFIELEGRVDGERLRQAARTVLIRHPNLRAGFRYEGLSRPVQFIPREVEPPWREVDLSPVPADDREAEAEQLAAADRWQPFDLVRPPLIRFTLIQLGPARFRLVMTNHHILLDGWSMPILLRELTTLYVTRADTSGLPPVRPYRDYLAWLGGRDQGAARAAWSEAFAELDGPCLVAPTHTRTTAPPGRIAFSADAGTSAAIGPFARTHRLTLNTVVQGAWALALSRLTGRDDVVFGVTVSGRPPELPGVDTMVGLLMNTLPLRVRIDPAESGAALLRRMLTEQTRLLDHQWASLAEIQRWAGTGELFDTAMVFENYPLDANRGGRQPAAPPPGIPKVLKIHSRDQTHYPLALLAVPRATLDFSLGYLPEVFSEDEVHAVIGVFLRVLRTLVNAPETPVGAIDALDAGTRRRVLEEWNDTGEPAPERVFPELFEEQVTRSPERVALLAADTTLTYAELNARANRLARHLVARGLGPERRAAIAVPRRSELVVGMLAVLKAGGAYLPIDLDYPAERVAAVIQEGDPLLLLTTADTVGALPPPRPGTTTLVLDDPVLRERCERLSGEDLTDDDRLAPLTPRHPAYVITTSGSTGRPKGVVVEHRSLAVFTQHCRTTYPDAAGLSVMHASFAFDQSVGALHVPLISGGCVRLTTLTELAELAASPAGLERATFMKGTPSHLALLQAMPDQVSPSGAMTFGGEQLRGEALAPWRERHPRVTAVNVYGPTEATGHCAEHHLPPEAALPTGVVPIGRPCPGTRTYVLDAALRPLAPGLVGELYLAGAQLARGYAGQPGLTAERFVADLRVPGARMYRTGDLARWTGEGRLEFVGRADRQVKLRGFRVELGDVEAALGGHAGVRACAVVLREDQPGDQRLVAYVHPEDGAWDVDEARRQLAAALPAYMVPAAFVTLEALPLTSNGKLDHRALPAPEYGAATPGRAPRSPREEILCELFTDILGVEHVGVDDSFFDLGGHSLLATRLVSRVRSTLNVELAIRQLFETPTVAGLAASLDQAGHARTALVPGPRPERVPLSFGQRRLWFLHQFEGPSATYNIPTALRLTGALDQGALAAAVADVIARHESLRTLFAEDEHGAYQRLLSVEEAAAHSPLTVVEVGGADPDAVAERLREAARHSFDLTAELPLRAWLFRVTDTEHVLLLLLHHIAGDGWSMGPLARDLTTAYTARTRGAAPAWAPLPVQYADYALWQHAVLGEVDDPDSTAARQLGYWTETLADVPERLALPTDHPYPATASYAGDRVVFDIPAALHDRIVALARASHASVFMVLHTALATLLTRLGAGEDIPLGTAIAGRTEDALDDLIGFFVNTLVLRTDTSGSPTFRELLARVRETDLAAYAHQDLPFERLVDAVRPTRSLAHHPLFQVVLSVNNTVRDRASEAPARLADLTVDRVSADPAVAKVDLSFSLSERRTADGASAGMAGALDYRTDLFTRATAQELTDRLLRVLEAAVTSPGRRIDALEVLSPVERRQLLVDWNATTVALAPKTAPELFEQRVHDRPTGTAVVCADTQLSYARLNARANQLARLLIQRGAGPEHRVAVALPRSVDLVVAFVAVLKAGAGYLPVDPAYPADRIRFLLRDAAPTLVLASAETAAEWPSDALPPLVLDDPQTVAALAHLPASDLTDTDRGAPLTPAHLAYMIYTSGTTGRPKGVAVTHAGLPGLLDIHTRHCQVTPDSRVLHHLSPSFDGSVWELTMGLLTGATLVVAPPTLAPGPELAALATRERVTHAAIPPAVLQLIPPGALPADLTLVVAAETCPPELLARWSAGRRMLNSYGPTESTVCATMSAPLTGNAPPPIGTPIANTAVHVLDAALCPVPPGSPGELYLTGPHLARGYHQRPGLTAERFVPSRYGPPGSRMYRTGDLVRWTREGQLHYLGRVDAQLTLRGLRIEPAEVEAAILGQEDISHATVQVREDRPGDRHLVAYVVPAGERADISALRARLRERLPASMVPSLFVSLDALPLTAHGKLDQRALPAPDYASRTAHRDPGTPREAMVASLFAEALAVDRVGVDDNFFDLGGHSLLAIRLAERVRTTLGVPLAVRDLFAAPTVADLCARIGDGAADRGRLEMLLPLRAQGSRPPVFCIPPGSGMSWCYSGLVRHLPPEVPVYGVQARGLGPREEPLPHSVESMAADYVDLIQTVQPAGPYRLLGWSLGGNVAFAMAAALRERGERVELLAFLDAYPRRAAPAGEEPSVEEVFAHNLSDAGFTVAPEELAADAFPVARYQKFLQATGDPMGQLEERDLLAVLRVFMHNALLIRDHTPRPYPGDVLVLAATQVSEERLRRRSAASWRPYVDGRIDVVDVDADHLDLVRSDTALAQIGAALTERLSHSRP